MPRYNVTISLEFLKDFKRLPPPVMKRTIQTLERMLANPWAPETHPEKVRRAESGIHSSRVDDAYRIIWKHIKPNDIVLCLVDHHDEAYLRAARKSFTLENGIIRIADVMELETRPLEHPQTLFASSVSDRPVGGLFARYADEELLRIGISRDTLPLVRQIHHINQLESLESILPVAVYDQLLAIALDVVERPVVPDEQLRQSLERYQGGDDLYRFVDSEEFKRVLSGPMEEWMLFLTPAQRQLVTRSYQGPVRVRGVVGSGKTVVAIHRARQLARRFLTEGGKVLFLTYGNRLPNVIRYLLEQLAGEDAPELESVECCTIHQWCHRQMVEHGLHPHVDEERIDLILEEAVDKVKGRWPNQRIWRKPLSFFREEIRYAIKGHAVNSLEEYMQLERSGRGSCLRETERQIVYAVYEAYQEGLLKNGICDYDDFILTALRLAQAGQIRQIYRAAVVDEIQDLTEATMRLLRLIVPSAPDDLFLVGDGLQRVYPGGYTLSRLGIDVVGRSVLLRKNYRNTQEILRVAHAMMRDLQFDDLDEIAAEVMEPEFSVRHGELPVLGGFSDPEAEVAWVFRQMKQLQHEHGYQDRDFALLYRQRAPYKEHIEHIIGRERPVVELTKDPLSYFGPGVKHTTFDSAKGLEFKVVFVLGVTDGRFVPRDNLMLEEEELADYLQRERRRLYVAMTRARDILYVTYSAGSPSRFLNAVPESYWRKI